MVLVIAAIAVAIALLVAALERTQARGVEREFRAHLGQELHTARIRASQVELMLDEVRAGALEIPSPADRDNHLLVSAPSLRVPGAGATSAAGDKPIHDVALSIDALPEPLKRELRAIEGDDVQREYLETIQRELAAGADADELWSRLFGEG